jgi:MYXO-CTERM domain-containing protein
MLYIRHFLPSATLLVAFSSSASAAIVVYVNQGIWNNAVANAGMVVETETFNEIANGFHESPFAGDTASVQWSASASEGLFVQDGVLSTNLPETLTFTFTPGVRAVGGNFFGTDFEFNNASVIFTVSLSNGTSFTGEASNPASFTGFRSTTAATISSLSIDVEPAQGFMGGGVPPVYPSVDNLYFGVTAPAPGAVALLGAAGLIGLRRRRN